MLIKLTSKVKCELAIVVTASEVLKEAVEEVAEEVTDVKICKVNVDDEAELAQMFHVTSIPLVVIMENGKLIKTSLGYKPKDEILELLK